MENETIQDFLFETDKGYEADLTDKMDEADFLLESGHYGEWREWGDQDELDDLDI